MIPGSLTKAQVVSVNADMYSVNVFLASQAGEGPSMLVRVLCPGTCDGVRINQLPLPTPGTLGVVAALDNDARSLVWLGALPANANDAITVLNGQINVNYQSHWSGFYSLMDQVGNLTQEYPDGTQIQVGPTVNTPTKHVVGTAGTRELVPVTQSDRVSVVPSPFPVSLTHATGTKINIDSSGNVTIQSANNVTVSGQTNILVECPTINISGSSSVTITSSTVTVSGNLEVTGTITGGTNGTDSISLQNHVHSGVQTGSGDTGPPVAGT